MEPLELRSLAGPPVNALTPPLAAAAAAAAEAAAAAAAAEETNKKNMISINFPFTMTLVL